MKPADLATVIEYAELAPSVLNTQPWTFAAASGAIDVRADRTRGLSVLDPHGRQLAISCGAAVEFARLAVRGLGWDCTVRVLPDPGEADLLATLEIGPRRESTVDERELVDAILRRFTDRGDYTAASLDPAFVASLEREIGVRGAWLRVLDHDGDRLAVIQALSEADTAEAADPAYRHEVADWLRSERSADGIPVSSLDAISPGNVLDVPTRDFTGQDSGPRPGGEGGPPSVERDVLLMVGTSDDSPRSWISAGQAVGWLQLKLTAAGLSSQPLGQAIDIESTRQRLARQVGIVGHVQFLLRTGEGHARPATGRRHVSARTS